MLIFDQYNGKPLLKDNVICMQLKKSKKCRTKKNTFSYYCVEILYNVNDIRFSHLTTSEIINIFYEGGDNEIVIH